MPKCRSRSRKGNDCKRSTVNQQDTQLGLLSINAQALDRAPRVEIDGTTFRVVPLHLPSGGTPADSLSLLSPGDRLNALAGCKNEHWYYGDYWYRWEGGGPGDPYDLHVCRYLKPNQCAYYWYIGEPLYTAMVVFRKFPPGYSLSSHVSGRWQMRINIRLNILPDCANIR